MLLTAALYVRGWWRLKRSSPGLISRTRLAAFLTGMASLWIAIGSPLSAFDDAALFVHMIQHIILMMVAPPLILLGWPSLPLLHGFPEWFVRRAFGPVLRLRGIQAFGKFLTNPLVGWLLAAAALLVWHIPAIFEAAIRSDTLHDTEHACFFFTSILFWWAVVRPYPTDVRWTEWLIPVYLFLGMFPSGALAAFLVFCDRVIYPSYATVHSIFGISAIGDQVIAGGLMWVLGAFIYLIPAVGITMRLLSPRVASPQGALPLPSARHG